MQIRVADTPAPSPWREYARNTKGCLVSNIWFDQNTDESKVIAGRGALVFWWRQVVFTQCFTQSNLSSPLMRAVIFLLLLLWSFEQLPKLHGPIWHLRKVPFSPASCRLFNESFCYRQVFHSCSECPAGLQAPCSLLLPFLHFIWPTCYSCLLACWSKAEAPVLSSFQTAHS